MESAQSNPRADEPESGLDMESVLRSMIPDFANAPLWHNGNPQISALVRLPVVDTNHRMVGNAILGLHFSGDTASTIAAIKLTWPIRKFGVPRFLPRVHNPERVSLALAIPSGGGPSALRRPIEARSKRFDNDPSLLSALRGLVAATPAGNGYKYLLPVALSPNSLEKSTVAALIPSAAACRLSMHVLSFQPAADYFRLCHETRGSYSEAESLQTMQTKLGTLCAGIVRPCFLDFMHRGADAIPFDIHFSKNSRLSEVA